MCVYVLLRHSGALCDVVVIVVFSHYRSVAGSHDNMCCTWHTVDHIHTADRVGMSHHSDPDRTDLRTIEH